jgi:hypothetical protein
VSLITAARSLPDSKGLPKAPRNIQEIPAMPKALTTAAAGLVLSLALWLANAFAAPPTKQNEASPPSGSGPDAPGQKSNESMQSFMRAKLGASTKILEGLALEDLDLIREGAIELNRMSSAEKWRRHDDMLYRQFSAEFRQTTSDLIDAAKGNFFDRAALKWMDATMNCIECHRYVRNKLVAGKK